MVKQYQGNNSVPKKVKSVVQIPVTFFQHYVTIKLHFSRTNQNQIFHTYMYYWYT